MNNNQVVNQIDFFRGNLLSLITDLNEIGQMLRFDFAYSPEIRSKLHNVKFLFNAYSQDVLNQIDIDDLTVKDVLYETREVIESFWNQALAAQCGIYSGDFKKEVDQITDRLSSICTELSKFVKNERAKPVESGTQPNGKTETPQAPDKQDSKKKRKKTPMQFRKIASELQAVKELADNPKLTCVELGEILGYDKSTVSRLKAWRNRSVLSPSPQDGIVTQGKDDSYGFDGIVKDPEPED